MRIVVLAMPCPESIAAIVAMREAGLALTVVLLAQTTPPLSGTGWGARTALKAGSLPGFDGLSVAVVTGIQETKAAVQRARPDVVIAACFPWRLPPSLLALPPLGCLNIHPSLLPRGRGPDPVFWTYRRGERETSVTVHLMDAGFDSGPIVAQAGATAPVGGRAPDLERALMAQGGRLIADELPKLASGAVTPTPQDDRLATTAPMPTAADFELPTSWAAERAFTFAYGVAPRKGPLAVKLGATGELIRVQDALDYRPNEMMTEAVVDEGRGVVRVRFDPGWARFLRAGAARYPLSLPPSNAREKR